MRSSASCAQDCTGYIKNLVTLWYFKPFPPPIHRTSSQKSQPPPSHIGVWCHLWMTPFFIFRWICDISTVSSSWRIWPWRWRYYDRNLVATVTSWRSITPQNVESSATQQWEPLIFNQYQYHSKKLISVNAVEFYEWNVTRYIVMLWALYI